MTTPGRNRDKKICTRRKNSNNLPTKGFEIFPEQRLVSGTTYKTKAVFNLGDLVEAISSV